MGASRLPVSFAGLLCLVIGSLVYINTLSCGIVYDDEPALKKNRDLRPSETSWTVLFSHDFWGTHITSPTSHKSYRPLCVATFRLNYLLHELEPMGYHLVNILLHGVVCYLYVQLCGLVLSEVWPALIAGLLFAVHPIHTEAVAGLVGRTELLAGIFYLLAFFTYRRAIKQGLVWVWPSLCLVVCSVLSKEQGVTVVGVCVTYDFFVHHQMTYSSTLTLLNTLLYDRKNLPKWFSGFLKRTGILATVTMVLLVLRITLVGGAPKIIYENINPPLYQEWPWRALSWLHLVFVNLWLSLCPSPLSADWRFGAVPLTHSLTDAHNILTLITLLSLAALTTFALSRRGSGARVTLFALSLMVFPYLPASNLFFPVGFVVAERVLYLPSMGLCLLVVQGVWTLHTHSHSLVLRSAIKLLLLVVLIAFSAKVYTRNQDWESNVTLYSAGVRTNPQSGVFLTNLGIEHGRLRNFSYAEKLYRRSMKVAPKHYNGFSNFGGLMEALRRYDEAEEAMRIAIELGHQDASASSVVDILDFLLEKIILRKNDRFSDALELVERLLVRYPTHVKLYNHKGVILQKMGRSKEAIEELLVTIGSRYYTPEAFYHLGLAYLEVGDKKRAAESFKQTVLLDHSYKDAASRLNKLTRHK